MARKPRPTAAEVRQKRQLRSDAAATTLYRGPTPEKQAKGQSDDDYKAQQESLKAVSIPKEERAKPPRGRTPERAEHNRLSKGLFGDAGQKAVRVLHQEGQGRQREAFNTANPERFKGAHDILEEQGQVANVRNLNNRQLSAHMGWDTKEGDAAVDWDTKEEPHPESLENPKRWEEMDSKVQARVLAAAKDYGSTPESMKRAYTAQLQRGLIRDPDHASFYHATGHNESGQDLPRERLIRSSEETGTPFHVNAAANAITSPQMAFIQTSKGKVSYPNDDVAKAAISMGQAGMKGKDYIEKFKGKYPLQGYPKNVGRAIDVTRKVLGIGQEKMPMREAWSPGGRPGAGGGDKVRAYYNAWLNPTHPQGNFFVSDTHSGGAGMAPHLAGTEHESKYLSIAGIHALHDHIARQVNEEHGLTSVSRSQSLQWNQEKIEAEQGNAGAMFGAGSVAAMQRGPANRNANQRQMTPDLPEKGGA